MTDGLVRMWTILFKRKSNTEVRPISQFAPPPPDPFPIVSFAFLCFPFEENNIKKNAAIDLL